MLFLLPHFAKLSVDENHTATGYNAVEKGFDKVGLKYMEASRMLGIGITQTF
ncbi:hypothetical protein [Paenibacillus sp. GP183]|uniref:hypothetical protein n=1 Tax=Paenibacillus sp. GP183 TaxID=1882751 RepID=UPI00149595E7|nr:hypothetical protein [Paenibacillus sp. GP183]